MVGTLAILLLPCLARADGWQDRLDASLRLNPPRLAAAAPETGLVISPPAERILEPPVTSPGQVCLTGEQARDLLLIARSEKRCSESLLKCRGGLEDVSWSTAGYVWLAIGVVAAVGVAFGGGILVGHFL